MRKKPLGKTLFSVLLLSLLLLLGACSGGGGDQTEGTTDNDGGEATEQSGGTIEVSVESGYVDYLNEIIPKFEEETGIKVEVTERGMFETLEALPLDGPAGLAPDVMIAPYDRIANLGQQGHLAEVTLVDDGRYDTSYVQQVTYDGKIYGAPMVIEALVLYYNKDLLAEAPATFKDLEELAKDERFTFEGEAGKNTAFLANWLDFYHAYGLLAGYGGYVFGDNGTNPDDIGLNTPEAIEAIEYASFWYQNIWPQGMLDASSASNFKDEMFTTGKAAAVIEGPWAVANYIDAGVNYGVATIPTLPNGEPYKPFAGGKGWVISTYTENLEGAQKFLDFVTNEENQMLLYEMRREIPANKLAQGQIEEGTDELAIAVINQYTSSVPMPNIPQMAEVWEPGKNMFFEAATGDKTAEQAANDAVETIKLNIEQKY